MNKNIKLSLLLMILVVLSVITYFYIGGSNTKIADEGLTNFAIEDTASIDQLKLSNTEDQSVTIKKDGNKWYADGGKEIDQKPVQTILKTLKRIQVKSPVPESTQETVMKQIIGNHVKVDIYQNGKLLKTYYVGHPTSDHYGTYMLLETPSEGRSPEPFIMYLPGHNGHLSTRFFANPKAWNFSGIFNLDPINIKEVVITNHDTPSESFTIQAKDDREFKLLDQFGKNTFNFDTIAVRNYLTGYRKVHYDFVEENLTESMKDSILNSQPFMTIELTTKNGNSKMMDCYRRPARKVEYDMNDKLIPYDRDLFIGHINREDLVVCQYYVFDKLLLSYSNFARKEN